MFIMQKITPMATTDPGQQRMMMMMPVMMGVMFYIYRLPSGLMLYYSAANVVGIAQQLFINRTMPIQPITPEPQKTGKKKE
jgi:YidC/Oxa1 family membrane protein insertase